MLPLHLYVKRLTELCMQLLSEKKNVVVLPTFYECSLDSSGLLHL